MKVSQLKPHLRVAASALAIATLVACGGGGGSSSTPSGGNSVSPPPPPPANEAPVARTTASPASPEEGQPFTLDASTSTDADGGTLTYSWSQLSGPPVTLETPDQAVLQVAAAEVTEDTEAVFRVTVSDGENSSTADVPLVFENIAQTPALITPYTYYSTIPLPFRPINWGTVHPGLQILGAEEIPGGDISFYGVYRDSQSTEFALSFRKAISQAFQQPLFTKLVTYFTLSSGSHFWVIDSQGSRIYSQPPDNSDELTLLQETSHQDACSTTQLVSEQWLIVGRRNAGFELYENGWGVDTSTQYPPPPPAHNPVRQKGFTTTNSICGIQRTYFSVDRTVFGSPYGLLDLISLLTYNLDTRSLELYSQKPGAMTQEIDAFELTQSVRAEFDSVNDLELIDHMIAENTLWLLFSDGEHKGDHRLIVAGLDDNRNIVQSTYQWEIGAPSGFGKYSFLTANPAGIEIVIFAPSSPQAVVFKPNDPFDWFGSLDGPYFFEVGLGASTGGYLGISVDNNQAIVTLHPDKQELKVFVSPPY